MVSFILGNSMTLAAFMQGQRIKKHDVNADGGRLRRIDLCGTLVAKFVDDSEPLDGTPAVTHNKTEHVSDCIATETCSPILIEKWMTRVDMRNYKPQEHLEGY